MAALTETVEKKEAQLCAALSASKEVSSRVGSSGAVAAVLEHALLEERIELTDGVFAEMEMAALVHFPEASVASEHGPHLIPHSDLNVERETFNSVGARPERHTRCCRGNHREIKDEEKKNKKGKFECLKLRNSKKQTGSPWHRVKDTFLPKKNHMTVCQEELINGVLGQAGNVLDLDAGVEQRTNVCQRRFARTLHVPVDDVEQICEDALESAGSRETLRIRAACLLSSRATTCSIASLCCLSLDSRISFSFLLTFSSCRATLAVNSWRLSFSCFSSSSFSTWNSVLSSPGGMSQFPLFPPPLRSSISAALSFSSASAGRGPSETLASCRSLNCSLYSACFTSCSSWDTTLLVLVFESVVEVLQSVSHRNLLLQALLCCRSPSSSCPSSFTCASLSRCICVRADLASFPPASSTSVRSEASLARRSDSLMSAKALRSSSSAGVLPSQQDGGALCFSLSCSSSRPTRLSCSRSCSSRRRRSPLQLSVDLRLLRRLLLPPLLFIFLLFILLLLLYVFLPMHFLPLEILCVILQASLLLEALLLGQEVLQAALDVLAARAEALLLMEDPLLHLLRLFALTLHLLLQPL
ncbi:hypothetical protein F7725_006017 [Dissostichus mawsoni]|uniref:Uncharacterized protein n=1 Tax=Dissostichus mawsoni TaxID=36200 RepID=A0A7J5YSV7_DISMA|nr:hypothetical protein F7725_006017 [Dissostichus mawsoni]